MSLFGSGGPGGPRENNQEVSMTPEQAAGFRDQEDASRQGAEYRQSLEAEAENKPKQLAIAKLVGVVSGEAGQEAMTEAAKAAALAECEKILKPTQENPHQQFMS